MASRFSFQFTNVEENINVIVEGSNQQEAKAKARLAIGNNDLALKLVSVFELEPRLELPPIKTQLGTSPNTLPQGKVGK